MVKVSEARKVLGWSQRCKLAYVFLWEYSYKRLKLAPLLGQLVAFLTRVITSRLGAERDAARRAAARLHSHAE